LWVVLAVCLLLFYSGRNGLSGPDSSGEGASRGLPARRPGGGRIRANLFPDLPGGGARRRRVGTIGKMLVRRCKLKRVTAALLPLSFLWLCACCVLTCGQEVGAEAAGQAAASPTALLAIKGETGCEEGCPLAPGLKAATAGSVTLKVVLQAFDAALPPTPADARAGHTACSWPSRRPPRAAPPLELLSVLRI
jgi:hypothetical protein